MGPGWNCVTNQRLKLHILLDRLSHHDHPSLEKGQTLLALGHFERPALHDLVRLALSRPLCSRCFLSYRNKNFVDGVTDLCRGFIGKSNLVPNLPKLGRKKSAGGLCSLVGGCVSGNGPLVNWVGVWWPVLMRLHLYNFDQECCLLCKCGEVMC